MADKLNFGAGNVHKPITEGWINADIDPATYPNVLIKRITRSGQRLPFKKNQFQYILADNVLEHLAPNEVRLVLKEFQRILQPGGRLEIFVPHFTGILTKYLGHIKSYGINSFCDERDMFTVLEEELLPISRCSTAGYQFLTFLNAFAPLFNMFGRTWQQIMEKFWPGGFEEIRFLMEPVKSKKEKFKAYKIHWW